MRTCSTACERRPGSTSQVLSGEDEARLTFLAVRRWYGWSSGRLLVLDIGGGSLEVATGSDEEPDAANSLPLGAGRLTRDLLPHDPPREEEVKALRKHVRAAFARDLGRVIRAGAPDRVVGTSKTFRSLARMTGAAPSPRAVRAPHVEPRGAARVAAEAGRDDVGGARPAARRLARARAPAAGRCDRRRRRHGPGRVDELEICPWALREGVILRRLDQLACRR